MFFQFNDEIVAIDLDQINDNILTAGFVSISELEDIYKSLSLHAKSVEKCKQKGFGLIPEIDLFDNCTYIKIPTACSGAISLFVKKNLLLIIDSNNFGKADFCDYISRCNSESACLERLTCALFERLIQDSSKQLLNKELIINELEETALNNKADKGFNLTLLNIKKELLTFRSFYEQLIDVCDTLTENENEIFDASSLTCFKIITEKSKRLKENVDILRDSVVHLWDSYQAYLDMKLNETMKIFTMMTTIFFPLTVIVGWYGMNFKYMPELNSPWGYPFVIALSISVISALTLLFKHKKWI